MSYAPGKLIDERYKVLTVLGQGGHGKVYAAEDLQTSSRVAIKVLHTDIAAEPGFKTRMQREARAMGQLAGTSAAQVFAFGKSDDGSMYIVMEYLEGHDLGEHLREFEASGRTISISEMLEILEPIAETLEAAHERGIIHRDLKPGNIFLLDSRSRGRVRLLDFGLAKDIKADPLTASGTVAGSPAYIAPEVWKGKPDILDHRIDVYSFGVIVFRMLSGKLPFDAKQTIDRLLLAVTRGPRPSVLEARKNLPPSVDEWVQKALAIDPNDRFQSVWTEFNVLKLVLS